jgi:hypothetical protein
LGVSCSGALPDKYSVCKKKEEETKDEQIQPGKQTPNGKKGLLAITSERIK